jgi:hypothetical protein
MKRGQLVLLMTILALLGLVLLVQGKLRASSVYARFLSHEPAYYAELAQACDSILRTHQGITNRFLHLTGSEASLPGPVRQLGATEVRVYPNRVWIGFDARKDSFALLWEASPEGSTSWALMTDLDGLLKPVYVVQKP